MKKISNTKPICSDVKFGDMFLMKKKQHAFVINKEGNITNLISTGGVYFGVNEYGESVDNNGNVDEDTLNLSLIKKEEFKPKKLSNGLLDAIEFGSIVEMSDGKKAITMEMIPEQTIYDITIPPFTVVFNEDCESIMIGIDGKAIQSENKLHVVKRLRLIIWNLNSI